MFQKFYSDTLGSRYIKSLLAQTPLPVFESVVDGDQIIAGCYYVYKTFIIQCNTTGVIMVDEMEVLYPSDNLYPSEYLITGTGIIRATFYVRSIVTDENPKTHVTFNSTTNYYDSETHYQLGRYLRYILATTKLNLFPYYNCYSGKYLSDVELITDNFYANAVRVTKQKFKTVAIPILFGHTYMVAVDCPTQVIMRAMIYDNSGFVEDDNLPDDLPKLLYESSRVLARTSFKEPIKFRIETDSIQSYMLQRNLYLVIQLPLNNDSSIVVLENYKEIPGVQCDENGIRQFSILNSSLLSMNTKVSYAFSDRLLEYLIGQVIHEFDPITNNIKHAQEVVSFWHRDYKTSFITGRNKKGIWDNQLCNYVYDIADNYSLTHNIYDQDGYLNKDILSVIYSKGGNQL